MKPEEVAVGDRLRNGFGVKPEAAVWTPIVALVMAGIGGVSLAAGDQRVGVFPWSISVAAGCLAVCCLGIVSLHGPVSNRAVVFGGWWGVLAFLGIAGAFFAIGVGDLTGLADTVSGPMEAVPVVLAGFGLLSMTPAMATLAWGVNKSGKLPWWGVWLIGLQAVLVPLTLVLSGAVSDQLENIVPGVMLGIIGFGWVMIGVSVRQASRT